jgi:hypothetical protein
MANSDHDIVAADFDDSGKAFSRKASGVGPRRSNGIISCSAMVLVSNVNTKSRKDPSLKTIASR